MKFILDRSQWHITENVHEPIISRSDFETVQRILENAPVKRPNGDGEIHPLSGLLFCKDCGAKMHIRIDYRNGGKRHVAFCSEYHKGKAKNPKCHSPHIMDADLLMQTIAEVLKKIEDYSISNRAEFEALVKKNLAMQQTDQTKKQQKIDGYGVCEVIRQKSQVPIIMLTALSDEENQLKGFKQQIDDYIPKPFSPKILLCKIAAILRRRTAENQNQSLLTYKELSMDVDGFHVYQSGNEVVLTSKEFVSGVTATRQSATASGQPVKSSKPPKADRSTLKKWRT